MADTEYMSNAEFQQWLAVHGKGRSGERGREPVYESVPAVNPVSGLPAGTERKMVGTKVTAWDGATIILRRNDEPGPGLPEYVVQGRLDAAPDEPNPRTPAQTRGDEAIASQQEIKAATDRKDQEEKEYNATHPDEFGVVASETNRERAERVAKRRSDENQARATEQQIAASRASTQATTARITQDQDELASREREGAAGRALTARQIANQEAKDAADAKKPVFLSQADTKTPKVAHYDPVTGQTVYEDNQNYDAIKAAAEERRAEIATQISQRQISLDEGKQIYTQWFDTNVKVPLMQAQEARAKAEEQRQALDAEERRRQFASDYRLRKATLGETAAQRATQAEISTLPYRSGPTWGEDFSSAVNSLAAGGKVSGPDAGAGIHFSDSSFAFNKPNFKAIAAEATKAVLGGLTDYRPSSESYSTGDYSGIPQISTAGMPAYSYGGGGAALPAPNPEYTQ